MSTPAKPARRFPSVASAAALWTAALLTVPFAADAQTAAPATTPAAGQPMTPQEVGGMNCLLFGSFAAAGVYVYNDVIMVAVAGYVNPALLVPTMAAAFVAGCGVANTVTPALLFLNRRVF